MNSKDTSRTELPLRAWLFIFGILFFLITGYGIADEYHVIPFDIDPPVMIDGKLDDWADIPNVISLNKKKHITFGGDKWSGINDLSGRIHLAWRAGGIFLAAEVVDDKLSQPYSGVDIWKGDHINLWMDFTPGAEPERKMFGPGQFHLVVSPGNLGGKAGEKTIAPEIHIYRPEGLQQKDEQVAAIKTNNGYIIEAYIPFSSLGVDVVRRDQDANFEVAFSDSDQLPAIQETMATSGTKHWSYSRDRMSPVVFGDGNGKAVPPVRAKKLLENTTIPARENLTVEFVAEEIPQGKEPYIFFKARVHYSKPAGYVANTLAIEVNGKAVVDSRLSNRPATSTMMDGREYHIVTSDGMMALCYTPTFEAVDKHPRYGLIGGVKACEFEFAIGGLIDRGKNTIVFKNLAVDVPETSRTIHLADVEYRVRQKLPPPPPPKPAPTGPIPYIEPKRIFPKTYSQLKRNSSQIHFTVNGRKLTVQSRFSAPDGKWYNGSNSFFSHKRQVIEHNEWIEVRDTFRNLTNRDVPVIQEHNCPLGESFRRSWLGGLKIPSGNGNRKEKGNPSVFASAENCGIGMLPLNDEFLVHVSQSSDSGAISIKDNEFYLAPGKEYTAELAIIPVNEPDFWAFTNAARRLRGVNFQLKLCFAFMFHGDPVYKWTDSTFKNFVENKGANFLVKSIYGVRTKEGKPARCTDWIAGPHTVYTDWVKRVKRLYPEGGVKTGIYFHCFLDTTKENAVRFKDDRALDNAGNHLNYGGKNSYANIYIPTLEKGHWGEELDRWIDIILYDIGADGIFWDEFSRSRVEYVYNKLDGCSADIDSSTLKMIRPKGSLALLSKDFRLRQVKRIVDAGRPFIINGMPITRTLINMKFPAFVETGSITRCRRSLLYSPIALGDHLTERKYIDSYRTMLKALDHGCLYAWYKHIFHNNIAPTHYMYPFTPIELHSGYLFGKERIVTKKSGYFGWGDNSDFEAHIFNCDGIETEEINVPKVRLKGKSYAELRLPEDYYAIIVRK